MKNKLKNKRPGGDREERSMGQSMVMQSDIHGAVHGYVE